MTAPGTAPLRGTVSLKTSLGFPMHNDSVPKGVNDRRGNNVEGLWGC